MQGKDSGAVNFDDQDWDLEQESFRPRPDPTVVWKVAAGVAVGIVIGGALMWAIDDRGAGQPATLPVLATEAMRPAAEATAPATVTSTAKPAQPLGLPAAASAAALAPQDAERKAALALRAAQRAAERKERAWASFYRKAAACDDSSPDADMVECANHFIRTQREFEQLYAAGKPVLCARATTASCGSPSGTGPTHARRY